MSENTLVVFALSFVVALLRNHCAFKASGLATRGEMIKQFGGDYVSAIIKMDESFFVTKRGLFYKKICVTLNYSYFILWLIFSYFILAPVFKGK